MIKFEFDITTDLVQKQKRSMFKDQYFMDIEVANELALAYRDKDVKQLKRLLRKRKLSILTDTQIIKSFQENFIYFTRLIKQLNPIGKYYTPTIDLDRNWGTDIIPFIRDINDSVQDDTLVFLTDRQKYVYDKIQALPKGIDSIGLMIANNTVIDDESQNQTMMCTP
ncbi:MAG: hypothetical protein EZS28_029339 [Streblomastix strix]|uniref:Uncharacterized protein n=1 Tax=Streblomastix strix TaxID=222440 RepID=A0A5J4UXS1_9EUKA|nr:MAG: hypothetical protein EZS28_029339 [Streblomastix strix]